MTALIDGEVQDVTLEINTTVIVANDGTVGLVHSSSSNELLGGQEIDGAIGGIEAIEPDVDGMAVDINKSPVDKTMAMDGKSGADSTNISI